jgi:hypothetical protein
MRRGEYAKHFIGEGLADGIDFGEVEYHGFESIYAVEQPSCL